MSEIKQKLEEVKAEAWTFYKIWRSEKTFSPALNCYVRVSLIGWNHLVGNGNNKQRHPKDVFRRMKLLPYAKEIINKSTTIQNITVKNGLTYYALEAMIMVKGREDIEEYRKIRVIIIEDRQKYKVFFSIMDKKNNGKNGHKK